MDITVQKWGNSLAVRIPRAFAVNANIKKGAKVNMSLSEGKIILTPLQEREYTLEELLSGVTQENIHREISTGEARGEEIW